MKTFEITISEGAYKNLMRFVTDERTDVSQLIDTLLTWKVPSHCPDMIVGNDTRHGDGTFAALTLEYRYLALTDEK